MTGGICDTLLGIVGFGMVVGVTPSLAGAETLRVPGGHGTIQAAIDAASEGDVVLVAPGTYRERLRLRPGITVRSAGDDTNGKLGLKRAEQTVLDGGGDLPEDAEAAPGVAMAEGATLDGFTVTKVGRYDEQTWQKHFATRGEDQHPEQIGHFGAPGIGADGAHCRIVNNLVHHNGHTGIALRGPVEAPVEVEVVGHTCFRTLGGGIGILHGVTGGEISGNDCFENFYAGIGHSGGSPLVRDNRCHGNIRAGIGISEGACPVVRSNKCYENRRAGIGIRTGGATRPLVEQNECYRNGMAGIGCRDEAEPQIRQNRCYENEMAGIGARGNAKPTITGNECERNKLAGIGFAECAAGSAVVRGNILRENGTVGIGVHAGWKVEIAENSLVRRDGLPPGIMVFEGADCTIRENSFEWSGVAGVRVAGVAVVRGNTFDGLKLRAGGPPQSGVWALPGSKVAATGNTFRNMRHGLHADGALVTAAGNTARGFAGAAFVVQGAPEPPELRDNVAISDDPKAVAVLVDGKKVEGGGNLVKPPK